MTNDNNDVPVKVTQTKARSGVTGHNVRYVLFFGLVGVIVAFIALGIFYGAGDKPNPAPDTVTNPPASQGDPSPGQ